MTESSGASVIVPAGALTTDTTIRVAMDSTGAPTIPAGLSAAGNMYIVTPHGGDFVVPIEVSIPAPAVTLLPTQQLKLAKAQPGGEWTVLNDTVLADGKLKASVTSFSFFTSVIINYVLPLAQAAPYAVTVTLNCGTEDCGHAVGFVDATYTVVSNNGQFPANCTDGFLQHSEYDTRNWFDGGAKPLSGYTVSKRLAPAQNFYDFTGFLRCPSLYQMGGVPSMRRVLWEMPPFYPNLSVIRAPAQLDVVDGLPAQLDILLSGGAVKYTTNPGTVASSTPTATDRATVDWQRSDDGGTSWRTFAQSFQNEANSLPFGTGNRWSPWSVRHGFIATSMDQGALIRVRACYMPPAGTAPPPCVTSPATLLNVLQQSGLPTIASAPRSILVRTGQTANFAATVAGLPAPTLQWQTRPANSSGAWSNVTAGTGATTANYTTAATALSDNGTQYRIVVTNAVGVVQSTAATVSVSDLDVAPTIATQPANLSVTSGSDAVFAIDARGTEALSYQWYRNGGALAGANEPVLRLSAVTDANAGSYSVAVSNSAGSATSNSAVLTVSPGAPAAVAPSIVTQPASVTANVGSTATLAVGVDGTGPFSFQWRRDGVNITGAASAVLTFNSVALPNAGTFSVVVTNTAGSVTSSNAVLDVSAVATPTAPTITSQPSTLIVPYRGSGVVAVGATGSGPLSYQWSKNGVELPGATLPVLDFPLVVEQDVGTYTVAVSNSMGSVVSRAVDIILLGAPVITLQPEDVTVLEGESTYFYVQASSSGLRYQWLMNGNPIPGAIANTLNTGSVVSANSGAVYSVMVYNGAGHVFSQGAVLTVQTLVAPTITQHPQNVTIEPGAQAEMCVTIGGTPVFDVQLQRWNGSAWTPGIDVLVNNNTQVCYFTSPLTLADNGAQYRFLVDNPAGEVASNTATVTVQAPVGTGITATTLVSRSTIGATADNRSGGPTMSADGNLVAFYSDGTNLVPGFGTRHGYVRNLTTDVTVAVDQMPDGTEPIYGISQLKLAAGGRYVVFSTLAPGITADDTNNSLDVFRRDLQTGTTVRLTVFPDGSQLENGDNSNGDMHLDISADGRQVIFASPWDYTDPNAQYSSLLRLFIRDVQSGLTRLVVSSPTHGLAYAALSGNGEYVAYALSIGNPLPAPVMLYDAEADDLYTLFTLDQSTNVDHLGQGMSISYDGRYTAFGLRSQPLLGSTVPQVVVVDRNDPNALMIASVGSAGSGIGVGNRGSSFPQLSDDGRYVAFATDSSNISGLPGNMYDYTVLIRDLQTQTTSVASRAANGAPIHSSGNGNNWHAISGDSSTVAYVAEMSVVGDGNMAHQVYAAPRQ